MNNTDPSKLLADAAAIGLLGVEMLTPDLYPAARDVGLEFVSITGHDLDVGFNNPANHPHLTDGIRAKITHAHDEGIRGVIVFSGKRCGYSDHDAIGHMSDALAPLAEEAGQAGVELWLELLNSRIDHPGQQCDRSAFAFAVARAVDTPSFKVLFDCYHMQIMEGNLMSTITANLDVIGHVHTAGVPGRRELDDHQEINWPAIAGLLHTSGYAGWIGHEFVPRGDPIATLRSALAQFSPRGDGGVTQRRSFDC